MSIVSSDIVVYASADMPEDDTSSSGGAIDTATMVIFTDIASTDNVEIFGEGGDESKTVVVTGRLASGSEDSETITLDASDATTVVDGTKQWERILKISSPNSPAGSITVQKDGDSGDIVVIPTGISMVRRPFYGATANATGGADKELYEKVFIKNEHATLSLLDMQVDETSDPSTFLTFDLEDAVDDNNSLSDRLDSAPTGMAGSFTSSAKLLTTAGQDDLAAGEAIGVWLNLSLADGTAAAKTTYELTVTGSST